MCMEKYVDKNSITSVQKYDKELICEINKVYKKPWKLFGLIPITKGRFVYQKNTTKYNSFHNYFKSFDDAFDYYFYRNRMYRYEINDGKIYLKPRVVVTDNNGCEYKKTFNSEKELDCYIDSLGINLQKNYITIKTD